MTLSMYQASVPILQKMLTNLSQILDKAATQAAARKVDPAVLLNTRLYPDMFPLVRQVQLTTDFARGTAARLAGQEVPKVPDTETTIEELKARIGKTLDFLKAAKQAQIDGSENRDITFPIGGNPMTFKGESYLVGFALPNFYFHLTTAYAILRHCGIEVGKRDFLGSLN
ncbi:MAG: DUF1993 domain-containing protein [Proteobacteria bacterium]|nr:DUF1993 domain-containing protein [Pseudomonadota bacterium]